MKPCPVCNRKFKNDGLQIHLTRVHGLKVAHDSDSNLLASESNSLSPAPHLTPSPSICPVPGCSAKTDDLLSHLESEQESWRLSSGKWVFEV